jgi:hypothetical protein
MCGNEMINPHVMSGDVDPCLFGFPETVATPYLERMLGRHLFRMKLIQPVIDMLLTHHSIDEIVTGLVVSANPYLFRLAFRLFESMYFSRKTALLDLMINFLKMTGYPIGIYSHAFSQWSPRATWLRAYGPRFAPRWVHC